MTAPQNRTIAGWNKAVVAATAIGAALSGFVIGPPQLDDSKGVWVPLGSFLIAVTVLLTTVPIKAWARRRHAVHWSLITILTMAAGITLLLKYQQITDRWTVPYMDKVLIHGSEMLPRVSQLQDSAAVAGTPITDSALVFLAGGLTERVWDNSDRLANSHRIALVYLGMVATFALTLIAAVQVGYCASRKK